MRGIGFQRIDEPQMMLRSVLGLAIFTLVEVSGAPMDHITVAVASKELDRTYFRFLSAFTTANIGDVIEARHRGSLMVMLPTLLGASIRCREIWGLVVRSRSHQRQVREKFARASAWQ